MQSLKLKLSSKSNLGLELGFTQTAKQAVGLASKQNLMGAKGCLFDGQAEVIQLVQALDLHLVGKRFHSKIHAQYSKQELQKDYPGHFKYSKPKPRT